MLRPEIQHKKPPFQYNSYRECGFLYLISQTLRRLYHQRGARSARGTDIGYHPMRCPLGQYNMPGTDVSYHATHTLRRLYHQRGARSAGPPCTSSPRRLCRFSPPLFPLATSRPRRT
eukprot:1634914-Rhodomonas_salina.1